MTIYAPTAHERVTETRWSEERAGAAIAEIAADAEAAFDEQELWPPHPNDQLEGEELEPMTALYMGASGVVWALAELARLGLAELRRSWVDEAVALHERYLASPDFGDMTGGPVPSFWMGESGILLVAHTLAPDARQEGRLLELVRENAGNPTWELMWGSPGTMLVAQVMHERTGDERWAEAWRDSADRLWQEWREDVWLQELYGRSLHFLGPAHGFAGNVYSLARGDLLDGGRRRELEQRTLAALEKYMEREDGLAQWPPVTDQDSQPDEIRTQWCHGSPGMVASLAGLAPDNDELTELLLAGGELTWQAGPLAKGANLCHGTAGNGYAFLKLLERTGDELWLERARAFGVHAVEQVERTRAEHGRGRYTLWTGDVGTALYLWSCLEADAAVPTLDRF